MLTKAQKEQLRKSVAPILGDLVKGAVKEEVQTAMKKALAEARDDMDSTESRIFNKRNRELLEKGDQGYGVTRLARCLALARNDHEKAAQICKKTYDDELGEIVAKALSSGDNNQGGVFVPENLATSFIDMLRARAVVRAAGPNIVDLTGGSLKLPKVVTDPTAGWVGENRKRSASNLRSGALNFTSKTLQGKSSTTMKLLQRSGQNAEKIMRDGLVKVMANTEDTAFLSGAGTENTPKGMLNWAASANKFNSAGTTLSNVQSDISGAEVRLANANVEMENPAWFASRRSEVYLKTTVRDKEDTPVFKAELSAAKPTLNGYQFHKTNNIPNNLGGGTQSRIYFAEMSHMWLGEEGGLNIRASTEASFQDEDGTTVSAFDYGLMAIIMERDVDFVAAHAEAIAVIQAVTYGYVA